MMWCSHANEDGYNNTYSEPDEHFHGEHSRQEHSLIVAADDPLHEASWLGGTVLLDAARPAVLAFVLVYLGGLGVELGSHKAQTLGAGEIEAASRDAEAVFGLATQELGGQHQLFCFLFS